MPESTDRKAEALLNLAVEQALDVNYIPGV